MFVTCSPTQLLSNPSVQSAKIWIPGSPPNLPQPNKNSKLHAREIVNFVKLALLRYICAAFSDNYFHQRSGFVRGCLFHYLIFVQFWIKNSANFLWLKMGLFVSNIWAKSKKKYFPHRISLLELKTSVLKTSKPQPYFLLLQIVTHCSDTFSNTVWGHNLLAAMQCNAMQRVQAGICNLYGSNFKGGFHKLPCAGHYVPCKFNFVLCIIWLF